MIVNIRGTSGAGKTTVVRWVMDQFDSKVNLMRTGAKVEVVGPRKRPYGYLLKSNDPAIKDCFLVGHYETACGGCDTIPSYDAIFALIREADDAGLNVLFEGLLLSEDFKRTAPLHEEGRDLLVVAIDLPLDECIESINARRRLKKPDAEPVNPGNTTRRFRSVIKKLEKMEDFGITVIRADRTHAREIALAALTGDVEAQL